MPAYTIAPCTEPVGIVISHGDRTEPTPRFAAWIPLSLPMENEPAPATPKAA